MLKTILVPLTGLHCEEPIFDTALAVARSLQCHIEFDRLRFSAAEAASRSVAAGFCVGEATRSLLNQISERDGRLADELSHRVHCFCNEHGIADSEIPGSGATRRVSAHLMQRGLNADSELLVRCRHSDLVVLERPTRKRPQLAHLIELLLLNSGRPVLVSPAGRAPSAFNKVIVGWQSTAPCARSLTAAIPLLQVAKRVYLVPLEEAVDSASEAMMQETAHLAWHGVRAHPHNVSDVSASNRLLGAARELQADLLVAGAFDHKPLLDGLLGGVAHALMRGSDFPLLLAH